jgi:hypothetical protein
MEDQILFVKLNQIKNLVDECLGVLPNSTTLIHKSVIKKEGNQIKSPSDYILAIVNKIKDCEESDQIEKEILDKTFLPGRILLPFYICYKYFSQQGLTTGDIAKITSELRMKIQTPNVSKAIATSLHKFLEGDSTRIKGKAVFYRLNRKGAKYFESLINPNEKE